MSENSLLFGNGSLLASITCEKQTNAVVIHTIGFVDDMGIFVNDDGIAVRPALWISLEK